MTVTELYVIVGKAIPNNIVFSHVLNTSVDFHNSLKSLFEDGDWSITFNQFREFINDGAPSKNTSQKWSETEHGELTEIYGDWMHDLSSYEWSLPSGQMMGIHNVPHDIAGDVNIVGKIVQIAEKEKLFEINIGGVNDVIEEMKREEEWKDAKIYVIPNDCACCS